MAILERMFSRRKKERSNGDHNVAVNGVTAASTGSTNGTYTNGTTNGHHESTNGTSSGEQSRRQSVQAYAKNLFGRPALVNGKTSTEAHGRYPDPPNHGESRQSIGDSLHAFSGLVSHMMRPLPEQSGDGSYLKHEDPHPSLFKELSTIGFKDIKTLKDQFMAGKDPIGDKTMLMERVIQLVADLPDKSVHRTELTNKFVDTLFTSLQHPPLSYLGDKFRYRQADGSYNNIMYPHIGAANTPYARTVYPEMVQPGALPDPALIFDSLFARDKFEPHPNNNSSVIFYWASIIIHDLFQTDREYTGRNDPALTATDHDFNNSQTSSYLDLSPLYGDTQEDQDMIRTFKDGMLKPDCFAEHRLLTFPPGCGVILIMFNRFHNFVAKNLADINENGRFTKPRDGLSPEAAEKAWKKYDNDLFQTARLVTGGLYMNITLIDYVRTIINLTRSNTTWTLDPRVKMGDTLFNGDGTPRGVGNQVSAEFNLVYRWHSAISEKDDQWTQDLFKKMWGKPAEELSMPELMMGLHKWEQTMPKDPFEREFAELKREPDGRYPDDDLVELITASVEDVAGRFGANHVPKSLKCIEILGMQQSRAWSLASLNEFRKFFGLKQHDSFESINPDPLVAEQLRNLYDEPDRVELYPGLVAEAAKQPMGNGPISDVGVGICPTYTISRAILSDAVALVRGDRFYTIDYNPRNLTNWGYTEVQYDFNIEQGCSFYKLFLRAFPNHFKPNSIYAHMPMTTPEENRKIMRHLGRESHYSWDRPKRQPDRVVIQGYKGVEQVLKDATTFKVINLEPFEYLYGPLAQKFMLCGDGQFFTEQKQVMAKALYHEKWHAQVREFYEYITLKLLKKHSKKIAGVNHVDMTRDVGNIAHVHFVANVFSLPLKTEEHPRGVYTEQEMWLVMAAQFAFLFFGDTDVSKLFALSLVVRPLIQQLGALVLANVKFVGKTGWLAGITDKKHQTSTPLGEYGVHMIRKLLESGKSAEEVTWSELMGTAGAMVANQAQVFTQVLEFYMTQGREHWPEIQRLAQLSPEESEDKLMRYVLEANRLTTLFGGYRDAVANATIDDNGFQGSVNVKAGDRVFVSFVKACMDPAVFPEPHLVKLDRNMDSYITYGLGPHRCLGEHASKVALTSMIRVCAKLQNLRPAPGPQGLLKSVPREAGFKAYMTEDWGKYFPFPTTWKLQFDGEVPLK